MVEFRRDAEAIIKRALQGQRMILTYRGKPVLRLEPIDDEEPSEDDPFYRLPDLAIDDESAVKDDLIFHLDKLVSPDSKGEPLTNEEIDRIVYGI